MKKKLSQLFLKSFAIAAGLTAGIVGVSLVAITITTWNTTDVSNWNSGDTLGVSELNAIGNNLTALRTAVEAGTHLEDLNCGGGESPEYDGTGWDCKPATVPQTLIFPGAIVYPGSYETYYFTSRDASTTNMADVEIQLPRPGTINQLTFYIRENINSTIYVGYYVNNSAISSVEVNSSYTPVTITAAQPISTTDTLSFFVYPVSSTNQIEISPVIIEFE